jgi:hypothetical protein
MISTLATVGSDRCSARILSIDSSRLQLVLVHRFVSDLAHFFSQATAWLPKSRQDATAPGGSPEEATHSSLPVPGGAQQRSPDRSSTYSSPGGIKSPGDVVTDCSQQLPDNANSSVPTPSNEAALSRSVCTTDISLTDLLILIPQTSWSQELLCISVPNLRIVPKPDRDWLADTVEAMYDRYVCGSISKRWMRGCHIP